MSEADQLAAKRIIEASPVWTGLGRAADLIDLPPATLLHAGPPFETPDQITRPVLNAAIHAARFEGWALSAEDAEAKIRASEIKLLPAQDFNVVVPLAFVLSPAMWLQVVEDASDQDRRAFAPINAGMVLPLAHGGSDDPATIDRHRFVNDVLVGWLQPLLHEPIELLPIIDQSLANGDECHGRTGVGTAEIRRMALERLPDDEALADFLEQAPGFFLFLVMAATKCMLMAGEGVEGSAIVTSAGGNGRQFGIKLANNPNRWFSADCAPPKGPFFDGSDGSDKNPLGGIGDSAVIDALGLGGMSLTCAPELAAPLAPYTPPNDPDQALEIAHPALLNGRKRVGLNARRMLQSGQKLHAVLGILDADGHKGIIGRGVFEAPSGLFEKALN